MRFRKSFGFGPFRATISKSGISFSAGVKGARITKKANGKVASTVGIPGTGLYHYEEYGNQPTYDEPKPMTRKQAEQQVLSQSNQQPTDWYDLIQFTSMAEKLLFVFGYCAGALKCANTEATVDELCGTFQVVDVNDMAEKAEQPRIYTSNHLSKMVDKGWFLREGRGIYKLNPDAIRGYITQWVQMNK